MIYRISNPDFFPSKYLGFVDPDDYYVYRGILSGNEIIPYHTIDELLRHIQARRESLDLPFIKGLESHVEHYIYQLGHAPRSLFTRDKSRHTRSIASDIRTGAALAVSLSKAVYSGTKGTGYSGWVDKGLATKRASGCINCKFNKINNDPGFLREKADAVARTFKGKRETEHDDELGTCEICECPLDLKVYLDEQVIAVVNEENEKPKKSTDFPSSFRGTKDKEIHKCFVQEALRKYEDESI